MFHILLNVLHQRYGQRSCVQLCLSSIENGKKGSSKYDQLKKMWTWMFTCACLSVRAHLRLCANKIQASKPITKYFFSEQNEFLQTNKINADARYTINKKLAKDCSLVVILSSSLFPLSLGEVFAGFRCLSANTISWPSSKATVTRRNLNKLQCLSVITGMCKQGLEHRFANMLAKNERILMMKITRSVPNHGVARCLVILSLYTTQVCPFFFFFLLFLFLFLL